MLDHAKKETCGHSFHLSLKSRLVSGLFVLVPLAITLLILKTVFIWTAGILSPTLKLIIRDTVQEPYISIISIAILTIITYFTGMLAKVVVGRKLIAIGETLLLKIPVVKSIYAAAKQVMDAMSMPDRAAFKAVVLVEFPRAGMKAIGFLTGTITDGEGKQFYKVFIPTAPNPTTGFFELVPPEQTQITDMPVEEAFKMIMSGGILSPQTISIKICD